jgi:hypothetical protein
VSAHQQITDVHNALQTAGVSISRVWLAIEVDVNAWSASTNENRAFVRELVTTAQVKASV